MSLVGLVSGRLYTWGYLEAAGIGSAGFDYSSQDLIFLGYLSQFTNFTWTLIFLAAGLAVYAVAFATLDFVVPWIVTAAEDLFAWSRLGRISRWFRGLVGKVPFTNAVRGWMGSRRDRTSNIRSKIQLGPKAWLLFLLAAGVTFLALLALSVPGGLIISSSLKEGRKQFERDINAFRHNDKALLEQHNVRFGIADKEGRLVHGMVVISNPDLAYLHDGEGVEAVRFNEPVRCFRVYPAWKRPNPKLGSDCGLAPSSSRPLSTNE